MRDFLKNLLFSNTLIVLTIFFSAIVSMAFGLKAYENNTFRLMIFTIYMSGIMVPLLGSVDKMIEELRIGGENCKPYVAVLFVIAYGFSNNHLIYDLLLHIVSFVVAMAYILKLYSATYTKHKLLDTDILRGLMRSNFKFWNIKLIEYDAVFFNYKIPSMKYSRFSGGRLVVACNEQVYTQETMEKVANFMDKEIFDLIPDDYTTYEMYHI